MLLPASAFFLFGCIYNISPESIFELSISSLYFFKEALKLLGKTSELKISIIRLASEVKKTIRKVNALEKIAIPDLQETLHYIQSRLEENERDMFVLMKMVKVNLEKKDIKALEIDHE